MTNIRFKGKIYRLFNARDVEGFACPNCTSGNLEVKHQLCQHFPIKIYATITELVACRDCTYHFAVLSEITYEIDDAE